MTFNKSEYDRISQLSNQELEFIMHEHGERYIMMSRKDMIETVYSYENED